MASTWGASWGSAWGSSWGAIGAVVAPTRPRGWDDAGPRRRPIFVFEEEAEEWAETPPPQRTERKRRRRIVPWRTVEEAIASVPWPEDWATSRALGFAPPEIVLPWPGPSATEQLDVLRVWLQAEQQRAAAIEDEEDIEMLLFAMH